MSRAPSTSMLDVQARTAEVVQMLGGMPDVVAFALQEALFDAVNHHRRSVLQHHKMPSKKRGREMLAATLHRYSKRGADRSKPMEMSAESFGAAETPQFLLNLERGGQIAASEWMAIPFMGGLRTLKSGERVTRANFKKFLTSGKLRAVRSGRGEILLVHHVKARTVKGELRGGRATIMGILKKSRKQRPLAGFAEQWNRIQPKHLAKFDKILDQAITEAGRMKLARSMEASRAGTRAYYDEQARMLAQAGGQMTPEVRKAANAAAKAARAAALEKSKGDA